MKCTERRTEGTKNAVYAKLVIWTKVEKSSNPMENTVTIQEQPGSHGDEPAQKLLQPYNRRTPTPTLY